MDPWTTAHSAVTAVQQCDQLREPTTKLRLINFVLLDLATAQAFGTVFNEVLGSENPGPKANDDAEARQDEDSPVVFQAKTNQRRGVILFCAERHM